MQKYLYLFRGGDAPEGQQQSPDAMQDNMQKWMGWMEKLGKEGKLDGGLPLGPEGKVVKNSGKVVTDGPYAEGKEVVGGYLIVNATSLDDAVAISQGCPIFEYDGEVEVRPLLSMEM